jgi:hypothetical protein
MTTTAATTAATTTYEGFRLTENGTNNLDDLKKIVDDFLREIRQCPLDVTVCRNALSLLSAHGMLIAFTPDQNQKMNLKEDNPCGGSLLPALVPNRIGARHFTRSSRVRNLVHGGMTGLLAFRLMNDSSQKFVRRWRSRTLHSLHVIRRVNGESGCKHLHWSIPEFQLRFNIGVKQYKPGDQHPYNGMTQDQLLARFNAMDTPENRQAFVEQCTRVASDPHHSRVMGEACDADPNEIWATNRSNVLPNPWITDYIGSFVKLCATKTNQVSDVARGKIERASSLVDLYRFMTRIDWIMTNPSVRNVTNLARLWEKYIERMIFMAQEGVEHAACMLMRYFPEMMTPELHVVVNPVIGVYRVPEMEIVNDDALFGALKAQCECHALLPEEVIPPPPMRYRTSYSDDDDDYYCEEEDDGEEEDGEEEDGEEEEDDDDDYFQG